MRISDWSSDVCSSDLFIERDVRLGHVQLAADREALGGTDDAQVRTDPRAQVGVIDQLHPFTAELRSKCINVVEPAIAGEQQRPVATRQLRLDMQVAIACGIERSDEHTSELQSLMRISDDVF